MKRAIEWFRRMIDEPDDFSLDMLRKADATPRGIRRESRSRAELVRGVLALGATAYHPRASSKVELS